MELISNPAGRTRPRKVHVGSRYCYRYQSRDILEIVTAVATSTHGSPTVLRADGVTVEDVKQTRLHELADETYPDGIREELLAFGLDLDGERADVTVAASVFSSYVGSREQVEFAHAGELVVARVFEKFAINWQYEEELLQAGEVGFCPDFYLPEFDLFVEITLGSTFKKKNTKLRAMAAHLPAVDAIALRDRDILALVTASDRDEVLAVFATGEAHTERLTRDTH